MEKRAHCGALFFFNGLIDFEAFALRECGSLKVERRAKTLKYNQFPH